MLGLTDVPPQHARELAQANLLVHRTASPLRAARDAGSEYLLEHPADRGSRSPPSARLVLPDHFSQCALGARAQKYTTFLCTPGLQPGLRGLASLPCKHKTHERHVGGSNGPDGWSSTEHAAYPADLSLIIARAIVTRASALDRRPAAQERAASSHPSPSRT
eukprot:2379333-Pleurochrysis_carterae.AAC.1